MIATSTVNSILQLILTEIDIPRSYYERQSHDIVPSTSGFAGRNRRWPHSRLSLFLKAHFGMALWSGLLCRHRNTISTM
jgi:hypothetical protein